MNRKSLLALILAVAAPIAYASSANQYLKSNSGLCFTENQGQWDERVLYKAEGAGGLTWWIERDGFTVLYSIPDLNAEPLENPRDMGMPEELTRNEPKIYPRKGHAVKFRFVAPASPPVFSRFIPGTEAGATAREVIPSDRLSHNNNYFLGNDHSKWAPNCGNYTILTCRDVWEGIDVNWYEKNGLVEFDFVVNPGADPNQIQMRVDGLAGEFEVTSGGEELLLPTSLGELRLALPEARVINDDDADGNGIAARFVQIGGNRLGVVVPYGYESEDKLVIDPLVYSTYLGGGSWDYACALAPDGEGGVVVAGYTNSNNFPTIWGAFDRSYNGGNGMPLSPG